MSIDPHDGDLADTHSASHGPGYYLPEHAQHQLLRVQDFLEFLATTVEPRTQQDDTAGSLRVTPAQLAYCFRMLAGQLSPILNELEGPAHVALTYAEPLR